jgi:hypothetical protein
VNKGIPGEEKILLRRGDLFALRLGYKVSMLSVALSQLLERARLRFGLEVEILDTRLKNVYPDGGTDLDRIIQDSPAVRRTLMDAIVSGRPHRFEDSGSHYRVYPLRRPAGRRHAEGLLAIRRSRGEEGVVADAEPWSDLARALVEADLAAVHTLGDERHRSRRLSGALRFLEFISDAKAVSDEATLAQALIQAAAVWYDVDARIYRRSLAGEMLLHTWLPGVEPDRQTQVPRQALDGHVELRRLSSAEVGDNTAPNDVLLVPFGFGDQCDWAMTLTGSVPSDAEAVLRLLARVAGERFASFARARRDAARARFEAHISQATRVPELVAVRVVHELVNAIDASSGSLALTRNGQTRRVAAIGQTAADDRSSEAQPMLTPDRLVYVLPLGAQDKAVLDLRPAAGTSFSPESSTIAEACAGILRTWLAGTLSSFDPVVAWLDPIADAASAFSARIQEELERAKRFDLRLSLILVDVAPASDAAPQDAAVSHLEDALRRELRGSDVTGTMNGRRIAALLTHTDALGLDNVVRRLRERLAHAAERLNLAEVKLGQAAFSPECRTADALLELALRQAQPVIVH